jgi:hypothetical protein
LSGKSCCLLWKFLFHELSSREVSSVFDKTANLQKHWLELVVNLLYYKCCSYAYCIEESKYGFVLLFVKTQDPPLAGVIAPYSNWVHLGTLGTRGGELAATIPD